MALSSLAVSSIFVVVAAASTAAENGRSEAVIANLLAQEFVDVCMKKDGEISVLESVARERVWFPRPTTISGDNGMNADRAWDGEVSFIDVGDGFAEKRSKFVIAVANSESEVKCQLSFKNISFESLKSAISNQGLVFIDEGEWGNRKARWRSAWFCLPDSEQLDTSYTVTVERRELRKRPAMSGSRYFYSRSKSDPHGECPIRLHLGITHGPKVTKPAIEPWLGDKDTIQELFGSEED